MLIKVNIPATEADYINGNGEGVWVDVDEATYKLYVEDDNGSRSTGILMNESIYYKGLDWGIDVPIEFRGKNRPVVEYKWLKEFELSDEVKGFHKRDLDEITLAIWDTIRGLKQFPQLQDIAKVSRSWMDGNKIMFTADNGKSYVITVEECEV